MAGNAQAMRNWTGPAVLSYGFRPFFFLAAVWAVVSLAIWVAVLSGRWPYDLPFAPLDWHVHSLVFGFVPAVAAGFLLTAVPNWTGRLPVVGWPLAGLAALWLSGRLATTLPLPLGATARAVCDLVFPVALATLLGREIVAGRNWRNLAVLGPVLFLTGGQMVFHLQAAEANGSSGAGARLALSAVIFLITLIGGRITPSFTRNWLVQRGIATLPAPFGIVDKLALLLAAAALLAFTLSPDGIPTGLLACAAGVGLFLRLARWRGFATLPEPLLAALHLGYAFVPAGFLLVSLSALDPAHVPLSAALHAWTAGAVGIMTLAVMTRASLGHSGRALHAGPATVAIYGFVAAGATLRIVAGLLGESDLLPLAGLIWAAAFLLFAVAYAPALLKPRLSLKAPSARLGHRD
ncbi:NnrS family protein [Frigidibacter sp. RF13]|uniref:NnrS family protein n=1 Tax=Frigidibacter sp. RF13 TaxID=2997340 RepID=UPI00227107AF|nr:NnrS family protein [Frigidibacter sp. RF13]MCY1126355.1 NnrS family protein [Frigidibacter sp. RF13]